MSLLNKKKILIVVSLVPCLLLSLLVPVSASSWWGTRHLAINPVTYISYGVPAPYSASGSPRAYLTVTPEPFINYPGQTAYTSQTYSTGFSNELRGSLHYTIRLENQRLTYEYTAIPLATDNFWGSIRPDIVEGYPFPSTTATENRSPINADYLRYHWNEYYANLTEGSGGDELRTGIYYQFDRFITSESSRGEMFRDIGTAFVGYLSFDVLNADTGGWTPVDIPLTLQNAHHTWTDVDGVGSLLTIYPQTKFGEAISNHIRNSSNIARQGVLSRVRNVDIIFNLPSGDNFPEVRVINQLLLNCNVTGYDNGQESYVDNVEPLDFDNLDLTDWLGNAVSGFVNAEIFPQVAIGGVVGICIILGVTMAILKIFAGG